MRIALCDYSGHQAPIQLARELARRGRQVLYLYFLESQTPKGVLEKRPEDPALLEIDAVSLGRRVSSLSLHRQRADERAIGRLLADRVALFAPDVVVGTNLPLHALSEVQRRCRAIQRPFVLWLRDIHSFALAHVLAAKWWGLERILGGRYRRLEKRVLEQSAGIIIMARDFIPVLEREFHLPASRVYLLDNWAPSDAITPRPKANAWARAQGVSKAGVVLYCGSLTAQHDASLILALAEALRDRAGAIVIVASEGAAAKWLAAEARVRELASLRVIPFQPFASYVDMLGAADVLIASVNPEMGIFSTPSKVMSYLCAGRAIVLSAPRENPAARIVIKSQAGRVTPAGDRTAFINAVIAYLDDEQAREQAGANGRAYAEQYFDIGRACDRFESVLATACS